MKTNKESGVVSIFAVIMFMVFVSIIAIGFIRIVNDEKRQAIDNDLSASAYASAQSGVEEAKRILLYCQSGAQPAACSSILNNTGCDAVTNAAALPVRTSLNIPTAGNEGVVSGVNSYEQRWTCMTIASLTDNVEDIPVGNASGADAAKSAVIPLRGETDFTNVRLSWHSTRSNGDGGLSLRNTTTRLSQPDWQNGNYPAAIRVQVISHAKSGINIDALEGASRTVVLYPVSNGAPGPTFVSPGGSDLRANDPNSRTAPTPIAVYCNPSAQYACTANLLMPVSSAANDLYLKVTSYYRSTHVSAQLTNLAGNTVRFNNVQPQVDVTGRTNDVFRRISARLQVGASAPSFAIESSNAFCKEMLVADTAANSSDNCP